MNAYEQLAAEIVSTVGIDPEDIPMLADLLSERVTLNDQLEQVGWYYRDDLPISDGESRLYHLSADRFEHAMDEAATEYVPVYRVRTEGNGE